MATLLKRVKNISKGVAAAGAAPLPDSAETADRALDAALTSHAPGITAAAAKGDYKEAFATIALLQPEVTKFFDDVMVMAEDAALRACTAAARGAPARPDPRHRGHFRDRD